MQKQREQLPLSHEAMLGHVRAIEPTIPHLKCRVVPTSFDPDDPTLCAFPISSSWQWKSLEVFLCSSGSRGVLSRLPLFWQLEFPLHQTCREANTIFFLNDIANMPLGAAALRNMYMDTVLTGTKDAREFSAFLAETNVHARSWFIIHSALEASWDIPDLGEKTIVAREVHLFPGLPLLEQCDSLVKSKNPMFHYADTFAFEKNKSSFTITGKEDAPFLIENYAIPLSLQAKGQCSCGKTLVART